MIVLGDKVEHRITGLKGVVTGRAEYLTGCVQLLVVEQGVKKEGEGSRWVDELYLAKTGETEFSTKAVLERVGPGGPVALEPPKY